MQVAAMSGIESLEAVMRGDVPPPPMGELMGMTLILVEEGRTVFTLTPGGRHDNPKTRPLD